MSDIKSKKEDLVELNPDMIFFDGLEDALLGAVRSFDRTVAVYDYDKSIEILMKRDGSSYKDAVEHIEVNTLGTGPGENMPCLFVKTESFRPATRYDEDLYSLNGKSLIDALNESHRGGSFKGWSFSDVTHSGSVLPMTLYDHEAEGEPITKHQAIVSTGMSKGSIWSMTLATTTEDGTVYEEFVQKKPARPESHIVSLFAGMSESNRVKIFELISSLYCVDSGKRHPSG